MAANDSKCLIRGEQFAGLDNCGGKQMNVVDAAALKVVVPSLKTETGLLCAWLLVAPEGKKLTLTPGNASLEHVDDLVSVVDGGKLYSQSTWKTNRLKTICVPGREMREHPGYFNELEIR